MAIDYQERIPNNVDLSEDRRLQRALEAWQPNYLQWWQEMGPTEFQSHDVYLRTAISGLQRLGQFRPCQDARLSLGHFPGRTRGRA